MSHFTYAGAQAVLPHNAASSETDPSDLPTAAKTLTILNVIQFPASENSIVSSSFYV